jgi:hypothetical protein
MRVYGKHLEMLGMVQLLVITTLQYIISGLNHKNMMIVKIK